MTSRTVPRTMTSATSVRRTTGTVIGDGFGRRGVGGDLRRGADLARGQPAGDGDRHDGHEHNGGEPATCEPAHRERIVARRS